MSVYEKKSRCKYTYGNISLVQHVEYLDVNSGSCKIKATYKADINSLDNPDIFRLSEESDHSYFTLPGDTTELVITDLWCWDNVYSRQICKGTLVATSKISDNWVASGLPFTFLK